ncbi:NUDIX family hydrolase [Rhizoctonia solani]|uniref:NUDIX family hydrolase n=1 Tax=Rhizoctonia solani TaxID=456999 RepID=A0A8H8SWF2_9AGAM|nr:NUDIX family hydrolase [Rhizoctonia solani]QRW19138.1 NUDIX family hydrolase [Rhizoctonia solani]
MSSKPEVLKTEELSAQDAKWVTLQKITWRDEEGKERPWEVASRKTRGEGGIDAVAILAVLRSKSKSFKPSTIIIEQAVPPSCWSLCQLPAGLISSGESVEETAIRELEEETGYKASGVAEVSPLLVSDPGMTSANMKLIALNVDVKEGEEPSQKLDEGEHIVKRIIELDNLMEELQVFLLPSTMAYPPHADPDHSRWQRELENLQYINHQLRVDLEDAQGALSQAKQEAAAYRDEIVDLKNKIEVFWDSIEGARAMFVRSFPNYNYRDSHKRSREADERERMSRKAQRLEPPPVAGSSAPGRDRDREGSRRGYPPEAGVAAPYPQEHDYRALPRGQPHLTVPVTQFPYLVAGTDKHAYPNGRSPYDTHPPGPYPDPAHPHVDPTRGHSASPHLATRIPTHPGHRHDPSGYPPDGQGIPTHARRESGDPMMIPPCPGAPMDANLNRPALPPAGAIIIHPPAAFQVSFTDLQPGIFLDRSDFGAEYPPNLDPPQGLQAVRCLFCDKHYSGANARSLWRRHVMGKHDFTMKGQRASTVRNRHMGKYSFVFLAHAQASITSIPGDLHESAPPSAAPAASPVQPPPAAPSRPTDARAPAQPGQSKSKRADGEGEHPESEDEHEPFDYQRHRGTNGRKGPEGPPPATSNGNGTANPLTHAALENWNKGSGAGSGGDVARAPWGSKPEDEEQTVASHEADRQREWCLCRRPDSWGEMIRCDMPTCAIQWYHLRCVGLDAAAKARDEWICEDCNRKNAQRRQEAHRDGPLSAVQDKDRAPALRTPEPGTSTHQAQNKTSTRPEGRDPSRREQDEDVVMRTTDSNTREQRGNDSNVSDDEPSRGGARKTQARRVLSEPQSSAVAQQGDQRDAPTAATDARSETTPGPTTDDNTRQSESPDQAKAGGTPKKKGWKGYALVPVPDGAEPAPQREYTPQTVTTPGGSRRTRSGKSFFPEDGVSASDGERQQSMETN